MTPARQPSAVRLRTLTDADWPLWREIRLTALAQAPDAFRARLEDWPHGGEQRWRARLASPGGLCVVAVLDDRPVGVVSGVPGSDGTCALHSLWVDPRVRGLGVSDRLIAAVEAWARASGATTLTLAVLPGNEAAKALYRRHGFTDTDEPGELLPDGVTRERVLAKTLSRPS